MVLSGEGETKGNAASFKGKDTRRYCRRNFADVIEYVLPDNGASDLFKGVTINLSESGLCLYTFNPVPLNEKITIERGISPLCNQTGTVRWIKRLAPDLYKVGLMFTRDEL